MENLFYDINLDKVPAHIAIIMDGNGRWAKSRFMPRTYGHKVGVETIRKVVKECSRLGVKYLTLYAFSTENWKRPKDEVDELMKLLAKYMKDAMKLSVKNNMRVRIIGDKSGLSDELNSLIAKLEDVSKDFTGLQLQIAVNYGGRDEIKRAIEHIVDDAAGGVISKENINEELISSYLDTKNLPDPDLLIRTSGELRVSNFLLWQIAYSEFYITDTLWPDFDKDELLKAVESYSKRQRRFGGR